jgi:hypothetical protein
MTRREQKDIMGLLGCTLGSLLNKPYNLDINEVFVLLKDGDMSTITVTVHPHDNTPPHLWARVETSGQRDTFYLKFHPTDGTKVGLMSARIGSAWHTSAVTLMEGWPTDLHPKLREIFVALCQQLDALRQPAAG